MLSPKNTHRSGSFYNIMRTLIHHLNLSHAINLSHAPKRPEVPSAESFRPNTRPGTTVRLDGRVGTGGVNDQSLQRRSHVGEVLRAQALGTLQMGRKAPQVQHRHLTRANGVSSVAAEGCFRIHVVFDTRENGSAFLGSAWVGLGTFVFCLLIFLEEGKC